MQQSPKLPYVRALLTQRAILVSVT